MGASAKRGTTGFSTRFAEENGEIRFADHSMRRPFDISLFSSPSQIAAELWKITSNGELLAHLEATSLRVLSGFALGVSAATLLGALTGYSGIAAEIMGASRGLGYLLIDGQTTGRPAIMMSSVLLFAMCGKLSDGVLATLSERWLYWQDVYKR